MISKIKFFYLLIFGLVCFQGNAQQEYDKENPVLFTDRDYCISGDTVWFKVLLPHNVEYEGNIVRVQINSKGNNLITSVIKKTNLGCAQGFIVVPDSLSSGVYFLSAFRNSQRDAVDIELENKLLLVYNRFEENILSVNVPVVNEKSIPENFNSKIILNTNKTIYKPREKVDVEIDINSDEEISSAIIRATVIDPLAKEIGGRFKIPMLGSNVSIPVVVEKDGFILSGSVVDANKNPQNEILIFLSIPGDPPYFDYCVSGKNGDFHFFLKDAMGSTNIVLQSVSSNQSEYFIKTEVNYLKPNEKLQSETKILTTWQAEFISTLIKGSFLNRLFNPAYSIQNKYFEMPARMEMPFYGTPTERVFPNEFVDLPDFQEISRELLSGVQYRVRNQEPIIRMLNAKLGMFFEQEPFRLLNGIPVFKNRVLSTLKSTDIKYIDIIQSERLFGDILLKGILAVALNDNSNGWMLQQPNINQFEVNCLQPDKTPGYLTKKEISSNQPDIRPVYLWELLSPDTKSSFRFFLSDIKGKVEISLEGLTKNNTSFKASKIIEVK